MKIEVGTSFLRELLGFRYSEEACEAIEAYCEELNEVPRLGDIEVMFSEISADAIDVEDYERTNSIILLNNGNVLIIE